MATEILDYKHEEVSNEGLNREYKIIVEAEPIAQLVAAQIKEESKTFKMAGFREGKVPESIVRKQLGPKLIRTIMEQEVDKILKDFFAKQDLTPASQPQVNIDQLEGKKNLIVELKMEVLPPVPQVNFSDIELEEIEITLTDEDLQNAYKEILANFKTYDSAEDDSATANNGDAVIIDFHGKVEGEDFEGNKGENVRLELGSGQFIPGFEDQLTGCKKGDKTDVKVKFPKQYHEPKVAGKEAVFAVEVKEVLKPSEVSEINDEFAKKLGLESVEKLKEMLEGKLIMDYQSLSRMLLKKRLFDTIDSTNKFEIPDSMVKADMDAMWGQVRMQMKQNPDAFQGKSEDELKKVYQGIAARRVRLGIILADVAKQNSLDISEEDLQQAIFNEATQKPGQESLVVEFYSKPENRDRLKGPILEEKAVDYLLENTIKLNKTTMTSKEFFEKYSDELNAMPAA